MDKRRRKKEDDPMTCLVNLVLESWMVSPVEVALPFVGVCGSGHGRSRWSGDTGLARAAPSGIRLRGQSLGWLSTGAVG